MSKPVSVKSKSGGPDAENLVGISDLLDALPFYALLVDETHHILRANKRVRADLGVEPEDIIGEYCPRAIHGIDHPFEGCPLEEAAERNEAVEREVFDKKKKRWLLSAIYPTKALTPQRQRVFFHMVTDITDRKQAEEKLKASHTKLRRLSADLESLREEERKKIGRDLHDETSQLLASLSAHLEAAISMLTDKEDRLRAILRNAQSLSVNIIEQLQRIIYELRPLVLDDLGLVSAISWLIDTNLKTAGIKVKFTVTGGARRLDRQIETAVFRVIQEAANNIVRHAQATSVRISLRFVNRSIKVKIADNGKGFDPEEALSSREGMRGLGLLGMKERIDLMNGSFNLTSEPGSGTRIDFEIPVASGQASR